MGLHRSDRLRCVFYPQFSDATIKRWDNQAARESSNSGIGSPALANPKQIGRISPMHSKALLYESVAIRKHDGGRGASIILIQDCVRSRTPGRRCWCASRREDPRFGTSAWPLANLRSGSRPLRSPLCSTHLGSTRPQTARRGTRGSNAPRSIGFSIRPHRFGSDPRSPGWSYIHVGG